MSPARLFTLGVAVLLQSSILFAAEARYDGGDGHLALQIDEASGWRVAHLADTIASKSRLRSSPAGVTRIDLPTGALFLGADTEAELDVDGRQIVLQRGRLRLVIGDAAKNEWRVSSGQRVVACAAGTELGIATGRERPVINVLRGGVRLQQGQKVLGTFAAPGADLARDGERIDVTKLDGGVEEWVRKVRSATEPRQTQGLGQLVAKDAQSGSQVRLEVASYHANIVLQPPVALVQIDQSFFNPFPNQQEGTFVFNLPPAASVSRFAMFVTHDSLIEGELIERKRADEIYTSIVRTKRDPAILEQIGDNLFRMRVFPIPGQDTKRILLDYTVPLVADRGQYRFDLPLMSDLKPIWDFSIKGIIHPPFTAPSVVSPTHPDLRFVPQANNTVTFHASQKNIKPPPHFTVRYAAPQDPKPAVRSYKGPTDEDQFFVVTVPDTMNPMAAKPTQPMDVLLLVDTSGSSRSLSRVRLAARTVAAGLRPEDRLRIGCVDVAFRLLTEGWCRPRSPEADSGFRQLYDQFALGISDLETTLRQSLAVFEDSGKDRRRVVVYLGDGPSGADIAQFGLADEAPADPVMPQFFAIRPGSNSNGRNWLLRETTRTGGRLLELNDSAEPIRELFEWSLSGLPSASRVDSVSIAGVDSKDLFHDPFWPVGRDLHLYGRAGSQDTLQIAVEADGQAQDFAVDAKSSRRDANVFAGRLWARQKLQALLGDPLSKTSHGELQIVQLCQEWSLMSPLTAFLVLETEQDYDRWKIVRTLRRRYWAPAGAIAAAPAKPAERPVVRPTDPSANQVAEQSRRNEITRVISAAERALKGDRPEQALQLLSSVRSRTKAEDLAPYNDLVRRVQEKLRPEERLAQLKLWRPVADRRVTEWFPSASPLLLLQFAHGNVSSEFLEHHPHARELLRPVPECPRTLTLDEFAEFIQERTGIPVIVDRAALQEDGVTTNEEVDLENLDGITVRSLLTEALDPLGLRCISDRHLLRITTRAKSDDLCLSVVYPVADLLQSEPLPAPHRLANPYLDLEEATRRRIEARLKAVVSVDFEQTNLADALNAVGKQIGTPIRLDLPALREDGIGQPDPVNLRLANVPAEVALKELLNPQGLTTLIVNERLKVTTQAKANEILDTRLYCAAGMEDPPDAVDPRPYGMLPWGMNIGGGFGGMGGGMGGMGGGMGGFAGGGGFGGGMMGGVAGGGMGAGAAPAVPAEDIGIPAEPFDVAPPNSSDRVDSVPPSDTEAADEQLLQTLPRGKSGFSVMSTFNWIQQSTSGKWMYIDQEGGDIQVFPLSQTMVIRQTSKVHREVAETMATLRGQLADPVRWRPRTTQWRDHTLWDYRTLLDIIQAEPSSKWMEIDQEGGSIVPHLPSNALVIRQTANVHERVSRLFTQLRRARYVAESLPYRTSLDGIDDLSLFDRPSFTELPLNQIAIRPVSTADEAKWLAARRVPASMNQRWRSVSTVTNQKREFTVRMSDTRLELALPDRTLRADGLRAAVAYPGLTLVEIDAWGQAVRQMADASLPWLPHRSNEELAELFDVTFVAEDSKTITLRFHFPGVADTYLQPTYAKLTRLPVKWLVVAGNEPQFELQIDLKSVVAVDPKGQELERWELIADEVLKPIPALPDGWGDWQMVDVSAKETAYLRVREFLRQGAYEDAIQELQQALREQPNQPLLNFLLAWCGEFAGTSDDASTRMTRAALGRVATSDASDLIRMITPANFRSVNSNGVLLSIPEERRSGEVWTMLAESMQNVKKIQVALTFVNRALQFPADPGTLMRRQLLKIELLLQTNQLQEADESLKALSDLSDTQLTRMADLFARFGRHDIADGLFDRVRQRSKATGVLKAQLLGQHALHCQNGRRRWELFLQAAAASPPNSGSRQHYLNQILEEADESEHANLIGELAATQKDASIGTLLRIRQAELSPDRKQAGQIVMDLLQAGQISPGRFLWALQILNGANRSEDIVGLVEARLRIGEAQELGVKLILREAYSTLGREVDARRAGTDFMNAPPVLDPPRVNGPVPRNGGGGFFSVK